MSSNGAAMNRLEEATFDREVDKKVARHAESIYRRIDRLFAVLMPMQWVAGIVAALVISPRTWIGAEGQTHPHVILAIVGGAILGSLPVALAVMRPGRLSTRMTIACSQVLFSSLLIHLTGGRIETHFHVFGSLAFLAAYRDWRVLLPATAIVAVDHLARGVWWPETVFGIATASDWRWLEHAAWVIFEDVFLILIIRQSVSEMHELASYTTKVEMTAKTLTEREVELRRARDESESANRAKTQFLANMSHEIRTPLNGILGFTELMRRASGDMTEAERQEHLEAIGTSGRHLLTLINDILDISKIEAGHLQVENLQCSPHQIIAEVVSVLRVPAEEKGISLEYRWESGIPASIMSDPLRLRQLLMNLLGNAIKFTEQGSVLVVAALDADPDAQILHLEVRDTGMGIAPEKLEMIFEPFAQADSSVTRKHGGTGLGLSISRKIAQALGGQLKASSEVGRGSVFSATVATGDLSTISIWEKPPQEIIGDLIQQETLSGSLGGVRILLVEDGDTNRKLLRLALTRACATVVTAENGKIAVDLAGNGGFDLVLMDMQMPVMDGYTATRILRERGFRQPIIALTAHAMKGDRETCEKAGCSGYLTKPIDLVTLFHMVREATGAAGGDLRSIQLSSSNAFATASGIPHAVRSSLPIEDPEIGEIVREFVEKLSAEIRQMDAATEEREYTELWKLAHWLKGAGGTVGFDCFTEPAKQLEQFAKEENDAEITATIQRLRALEKVLIVS
jgi:signal transduction histidine kinase/CheY-like chemotaxis protein/HPt (histidine-containing phosphotransfer) domain-containing protein